MKKFFSVWSALALVAMVTACAKSSPTQPTSAAQTSNASTPATSSAGSVVSTPEGATITTPAAVSPADNAQIKFSQQPVTLVVRNAVTTGNGTLTYSFEVATDSGFANKAYTKDGVAAGNGQTSLTIDKLKGATTYYWRAHVMLNSAAGPNSPVRSFTIGPEVILQAPVLATPGSNATVSDQPTLVVNNVGRTGPAGTIVYTFEISQSSDFSSIADTANESEQPNTVATSHTVSTHLTDKTTFWWRVQAADPSNAVTSPWSNANPFRVQNFDMRNAIIYDNPPNTATFRETAKITYVDTAGPYVVVDFDRRTGPNAWREVSSGTFGPLQYTLGMCFNIDAQWYCSAAIQFWYGRELEAGGRTNEIGINWYYDARWGRMAGHQPAPGETIGVWVGQGNLRGGLGSYDEERSNVALVQFGTVWSSSSLQRLPFSTTSILSALQPHK